MKNQSYRKRVQALAEKMAIVTFERFIAPSDRPADGWDGLSDVDKKIWVDSETERARIAVAEMAEAAKLAWIDGYGNNLSDIAKGILNEYLKEQGLIPDDGQGVNLVFDPKGSVHNPDNPPSLSDIKSIEIALEKAYPKDGQEFVGNMYDIFSAGYMAGLNAQEGGSDEE